MEASLRDSHHPGPPRFLQVGQRLVDPIFVDGAHGFGRDNLAPTVSGSPKQKLKNYGPEAFRWSIASSPPKSTTTLEYASTPFDDRTRYDHGLHNTAEFEPDVAGLYRLELEAPDGVHELAIRVFEGADGQRGKQTGVGGHGGETPGGPPRIALEGRYDESDEAFVLESNPELAPDSFAVDSELVVEYLPHDASGLDQEAISVEDGGRVARVPAAELEGPTHLYAAPFDGKRVGVTDEIILDPKAKRVSLPNRPPDWLENAVIYEIFTRSFAGVPGETDFDLLADRVEYLATLGVDVLWLTPIVPAWSPEAESPPGGPHGYSATGYFDVAPDLGTLAAFEAFVERSHDHGIRVCFDLVINHCGFPHPFFQDTLETLGPERDEPGQFPDIEAWNTESTYFDWFDRQHGASDHDAAPAQTSFFDVRLQPNWNYGNIALREYMLAVIDFWADRVDMFRCDIAWGVPHSFWKEARAMVAEKDTEFCWLGEVIPRDPAFFASEFDLLFDTDGFTETVQAVARGRRPPTDLLEVIESRRRDGVPRYSRLVNAIENHDESRLYAVAEDGHRDDPAGVQQAATAAAVTLPGVPLLYYGQERQISEYGKRRQSSTAADADDLEADIAKRAFMNWDSHSATHLEFYRRLLEFYHESPVFGSGAELVRVPYRTTQPEDVLVFGRDTGAEKRIVAINFAAESREVELRAVVQSTDMVRGEDVSVVRSEESLTVEVERVVVLETPTLFGM